MLPSLGLTLSGIFLILDCLLVVQTTAVDFQPSPGRCYNSSFQYLTQVSSARVRQVHGVISIDDCAVHCALDAACVVFQFFKTQASCLLGNACAFLRMWTASLGVYETRVASERISGIYDANFTYFSCFDTKRIILYTIKEKVNKSFYETFSNPQPFDLPSSGLLPDLYRSSDLDNLSALLHSTGRTEIVVQMLTDEQKQEVGAQVVFNVSWEVSGITRENWFSPDRVVSSFPFWIARSGFNYFSVVGHVHNASTTERRLYIHYSYSGGCKNNTGFMMVADNADICPYISTRWSVPPLLLYNTRNKSTPYPDGFAKRLLIYI